MHHRTLFLTALALFAVGACGVYAQDLALDGRSVNSFEPATKNDAAKHGADRKLEIKASPQSAGSPKEDRPEFGWTGTYGGIHAGGGSGTGNQGNP